MGALPPPCAAQKWSKGKVREKLQNAVMFDQKQYDRMNAEVPKVRCSTVQTLEDSPAASQKASFRSFPLNIAACSSSLSPCASYPPARR